MNYTVIYTKENTGGYTTQVVELPWCISYGETIEEAQEMTKEAIIAYVESIKKHAEDNEPFFERKTFISNLFINDIIYR